MRKRGNLQVLNDSLNKHILREAFDWIKSLEICLLSESFARCIIEMNDR